MNGRLPPTDPLLRRHLARRTAGSRPESLLADTLARLDAAPQRARRNAPRALRMPRLAWAAAGVAAIVLLAVAVAMPAFHPAPAGSIAGYPAERALTTAELAEVMAGPALPINTTLVATVTIQSRSDVCPMNRYPTIGVVEGMKGQVCVMGADLSSRPSGEKTSGTFAFRYIAPGYLGLLAAVTPASSRLAFNVAQDWPLDGSAFLVEGYLGSAAVPCATETEAPGDVLSPYGYEQCTWSWLSDDTSPVAVRSVPTWSPAAQPTAGPSIDWLALEGKARHVEAGGARLIDSIPAATTHGVFVVKPATEGCPGAAPYDSRGCSMWRVLAKVPQVSVVATPSPIATASPTTSAYWDPAASPLTAAELPRALSVAQTGQLLVADVSLENGAGCGGFNSYKPLGRIAGLADQVCVVGIDDTAGIHKPASNSGTFAFRVLGPGVLGYMATTALTGSMGLAYSTTEDWPAGQTIVAYGWVTSDPRPRGCTAIGATDVLDPASAGCTSVWLSSTQKTWEQASADSNAGGARLVFAPVLPSADPAWITTSQASAYLLRDERQDCSGQGPSAIQHWCGWEILGRIAPLTLPPVSPATATQAPTPTPTMPSGAAPLGLAGPVGRALSDAEFSNAWETDPAHLAGRIVIAKGPIPTGYMCWSAGAADASASPGTCHLGVLEGTIAPEGYWAVEVGSDGKLSIVGELKLTPEGNSVFALDEVNASTDLVAGDLVMVQGWLLQHVPTCDVGRTPWPSGCGPFSEIDSTASDNSPASLFAQQNAYTQFTGRSGDWTVEGPPAQGLFLVRLTNTGGGTILAAFDLQLP